ncbi:MAG: hypothetical protein EOP40_10175 [Rubrivivax sp.]|nr:MAG: hypothetical protein EOP40_10175 [Rubrivivax sp.]
MSMTQLLALETSDTAVLAGAQLDAYYAATPLVLDLNGDGVRTTSSSQGVHFDLNATGNASARVGWASAQDGLLVMDRNGDGTIGNGSELFGGSTLNAEGQRAGNGYAALGALDSNHDGIISAADVDFSKLQVWVDANQDGISGNGELKSLADLGILSMDLNAQQGTEMDNGNLLGLVSSYTKVDGSTHEMADVWFHRDISATGSAESALAGLSTDDVLAGPGQSAALDALSASVPATASKPDDAGGAVTSADTTVASTAMTSADAPADTSLAVDPTKGLLEQQQNNLLF